MLTRFKKGILSLFVPILLLAITACPGVVIDNILINFGISGSTVGSLITFNAVLPVPHSQVIQYNWDFGDGSTGSGQVVTHVYTSSGTFIIKLTVILHTGSFSTENSVSAMQGGDTLTFTTTITIVRRIAFQCTDGDVDICIVNADGSGTRFNLSNALGGDTGDDFVPQWSPNGLQLVYMCTDGDFDICVANVDGSGTRLNLSDSWGGDTGIDANPQWSPDGKKIAYRCFVGGSDGDICVANADGSGTRLNLSDSWGGDTGIDRLAQWSPDGSQIVYTCHDGADSDICVGNSDGSGTRLNLPTAYGIGGDTGIDRYPQWSPDGTQIAYTCEESAIPEHDICVGASDGSGARLNVSDTLGAGFDDDLWPQWSPDGARLLYACKLFATGEYDICIGNSDGSGARLNLSDAIGGDSGDDFVPQWSPDGMRILYTCVDGDTDICIANADGAGTRLNLSNAIGGDTGDDSEPQWSP